MSTLQHLREQLALSGRVVPLSSLRRVSSLAFLAACAAVVAASLAFFTLAEALIMRRDSSCSAVATTVLDKRFGYSPDAAAYALECWGSLGRAAFLVRSLVLQRTAPWPPSVCWRPAQLRTPSPARLVIVSCRSSRLSTWWCTCLLTGAAWWCW